MNKLPKLGEAANKAVELSKIISALGIVGSLAIAAWVQALGPGLQGAIQEFSGVNVILARIEKIEASLSPLAVVDWQLALSKQVGQCNEYNCDYSLTGSRTDYGMHCGTVTSGVVKLREVGYSTSTIIGYKPKFKFVRLDEVPVSFIVPLDIPRFTRSGSYQWRSEVMYGECPGINEPIIRYSPWMNLTIG